MIQWSTTMQHILNYIPLYIALAGSISAVAFFYSVHDCTVKKHGYMATKRPTVNVGTSGHIDHGRKPYTNGFLR